MKIGVNKMPFDYNKYYKEYRNGSSTFNMVLKSENPKDAKIIEILNKQYNKTRFVKDLILESDKNGNK